jgi:hypothetical protein
VDEAVVAAAATETAVTDAAEASRESETPHKTEV